MNRQHGFTLIELIMVIVILGILAATAIPRFVDLSTQAANATAAGVAGALSAAAAINYAVDSAGGASQPVTDCPSTALALEGGLPDGWTIDAGAGPACTVSGEGTSADFTTIITSS